MKATIDFDLEGCWDEESLTEAVSRAIHAKIRELVTDLVIEEWGKQEEAFREKARQTVATTLGKAWIINP